MSAPGRRAPVSGGDRTSSGISQHVPVGQGHARVSNAGGRSVSFGNLAPSTRPVDKAHRKAEKARQQAEKSEQKSREKAAKIQASLNASQTRFNPPPQTTFNRSVNDFTHIANGFAIGATTAALASAADELAASSYYHAPPRAITPPREVEVRIVEKPVIVDRPVYVPLHSTILRDSPQPALETPILTRHNLGPSDVKQHSDFGPGRKAILVAGILATIAGVVLLGYGSFQRPLNIGIMVGGGIAVAGGLGLTALALLYNRSKMQEEEQQAQDPVISAPVMHKPPATVPAAATEEYPLHLTTEEPRPPSGYTPPAAPPLVHDTKKILDEHDQLERVKKEVTDNPADAVDS